MLKLDVYKVHTEIYAVCIFQEIYVLYYLRKNIKLQWYLANEWHC